MTRSADHREALLAREPASWPAYLDEHSGLPGPRGNIELAVALAESSGVKLAGLLLTHDSWINGNILRLGALSLNGDLPILRVKSDSYGTATQVSRLSSHVPFDDLDRMNLVLESVAEALDEKAMTAGIAVPLDGLYKLVGRLCPTIGVEELAGAAVRFVLAERKAQRVLVLNDEIPDYFKSMRRASMPQQRGPSNGHE